MPRPLAGKAGEGGAAHMLLNLVFLSYFWDWVNFAHDPFKSGFSIPYSSVVFLGIFLVGFQSQVF